MGLKPEVSGPIHDDFVNANKGILVKTDEEVYELLPTNYQASAAPTISDNFSQGWKVGSEWTFGGQLWKCGGDGVWLKGEVGEQGPKGDKGDQGDKGDTGDAGDDGAGVLSGNGPPSVGEGLDDDFYVDLDSSTIYGPKAGGIWPDGVSLKGDKGDAGSTWLHGTNTPGAEVGVDGDFFIDIANHVYYGPKASGSWAAGRSLKGDKGDKGDQGDPGATPAGLKDIGFFQGFVEGEAETDLSSWQDRAVFVPKNSNGDPMSLVGVWTLDWYAEILGNTNSAEPKIRVYRSDNQAQEEVGYKYYEPENGDKDWEVFSGHKTVDFGNTPTSPCFFMQWASARSGSGRTAKIRRVRFKLTNITSGSIYNSVVVGDGGGFSG